jgi:hypothetical protein
MSTSNTQFQAFEAMVSRLNSSESVEAIVAECEAKGIKGLRRCADSCVLTNLINHELELSERYSPVITSFKRIWWNEHDIKTSPIVQSFVLQFDANAFPQLVAPTFTHLDASL